MELLQGWSAAGGAERCVLTSPPACLPLRGAEHGREGWEQPDTLGTGLSRPRSGLVGTMGTGELSQLW